MAIGNVVAVIWLVVTVGVPCALLTAFLARTLIKGVMKSFKAKFPPGPPQLPLIGNAHNVNVAQLHLSLWDHREKYGAISYFRLAGRDFVCLHTIDAVRDAIKSPENSDLVTNRPVNFFGEYILKGDIAFQQFSEDWSKLRCVAYDGIRSTIHGSKQVTAALNDEFEHLKSAFRENNGDSFDPRMSLSLSTINSVITTLIGRRFEYDHEIFGLFLEYDVQAGALFTSRARMILDTIPIVRHLPFSYGANFAKIQQVKARLAKFLLYDIKGESETEREKKSGMIYELLRAGKKHEMIKDENIESIILDANAAGVVSVRASLFALVYHLLHHPRIQEKIYEEIKDVIGENGTPCVEDEVRMPYTQAAILESLRITTVVPGSVPRCNRADMKLRGYRLPEGTIIMSNHWKIHHDEEFWEEPWTFIPERFLSTHGKLLPNDDARMQAVIPFGVGRRSCLGAAFARSRLFLYVVNICQSFEIYNDAARLGSEVDPREYTRDTVMYVPPYEIRLKERH